MKKLIWIFILIFVLQINASSQSNQILESYLTSISEYLNDYFSKLGNPNMTFNPNLMSRTELIEISENKFFGKYLFCSTAGKKLDNYILELHPDGLAKIRLLDGNEEYIKKLKWGAIKYSGQAYMTHSNKFGENYRILIYSDDGSAIMPNDEKYIHELIHISARAKQQNDIDWEGYLYGNQIYKIRFDSEL